MRSADEFEEVYLCLEKVDMRSGFDRLAGWVTEHVKKSVISGGIFVFISKNKKRVKALYWDNDGYALWYKRLEAGNIKLKWGDNFEKLTGAELSSLLSGMELSRIKMRKEAKNIYTKMYSDDSL